MKQYKRTRIIASLAILSSLTLTGAAFAATTTPDITGIHSVLHATKNPDIKDRKQNRAKSGKKGVASSTPRFMGSITAVNGSVFSLQSKAWRTTATTTYTVNTTNSTVFMKDGSLDSLNDLAAGQSALVTGTLDTTTNIITATGVNVFTSSMHTFPRTPMTRVTGTVQSVSGTSLTVLNNKNVAYTVDITNAKINSWNKKGAALADIQVGDRVMIAGPQVAAGVTNITATTIFDLAKKK